ncbi:MAG TPA: hypothetical protein VH054_02130 [Polyangiaceae bacterium]|jgi:hypothetical protein|nr:hypothetical protein [Polyangiaceae bacterium]
MTLVRSLAFALALVACNDGVPAGIEPITVYVVDAVSGAYLCKANVTLNGTALTPGGGNQIGCYFVPSFTLDVGEAYTLMASQDGYVAQTQMGTIQTDGSNVIVQLVPTSAPDASTDAPADGPGDAPGDAPGDSTTDAPSD